MSAADRYPYSRHLGAGVDEQHQAMCAEIDIGELMARAVIELVDEKAALEAEIVTLRAGITDASNALREQQPPVRIEYRVLNALDDLRRALRAGAT